MRSMSIIYYFCISLNLLEMKLLIVEDEMELLNATSGYLEKEDFVCESAPNFFEAEDKLDLLQLRCCYSRH